MLIIFKRTIRSITLQRLYLYIYICKTNINYIYLSLFSLVRTVSLSIYTSLHTCSCKACNYCVAILAYVHIIIEILAYVHIIIEILAYIHIIIEILAYIHVIIEITKCFYTEYVCNCTVHFLHS